LSAASSESHLVDSKVVMRVDVSEQQTADCWVALKVETWAVAKECWSAAAMVTARAARSVFQMAVHLAVRWAALTESWRVAAKAERRVVRWDCCWASKTAAWWAERSAASKE